MAEETILVVDDDRTTVRFCQRLLERASYQVVTTMDPLEALQILNECRFDLLLSDIHMPVMDGFELITRAKQTQPDLPVLVMTGYGSIENAIQALHRGVEGLILKPFANPSELAQSAQRVIEENRQRMDMVRLQALRPLFDVTERLLAETSPQKLGTLILNTVQDLFHSTFAGIYRQNDRDPGLSPIQVTQVDPENMHVDQVAQLVQTFSAERGPFTASVSGLGKSNDEYLALMKQLGLSTILVAPIQRNNRFVFYASREAGQAAFTEADLEMFVILARQAAVALENAGLYSELKDYVRRVEESQRALIQAEKMAAVGRLVASMAHEINNPLQAVRNCLHLASRKGVASEQRFRYLEMMDIELDRLVQTVRQMLDFYRPAGAEKETIEVSQIVNQVVELLKPQLRDNNIQIHINQVAQNKHVSVIPGQIQQVIFNLLINAMDALVASSKNTPAQPATKEIWIDVHSDQSKVQLLVEDSGPGITPELREQLFEPFTSTKPNGTGLGLAVSFSIMERHQGDLALVPSRYGQGACFELTLPLEIERKNGQGINR
jgi:signal transduction histidine kinase/CheY-like chemotaxis protein